MTIGAIQLRDKVLRNIASQREPGASWLEALPNLLRRLEVEWGIKVGRPCSELAQATQTGPSPRVRFGPS